MSDFSDANPEARWYVAHTYSGYENKVKANIEKIVENRGLQHLVMEVRVPIMLGEETDDNAGETAAVSDSANEASDGLESDGSSQDSNDDDDSEQNAAASKGRKKSVKTKAEKKIPEEKVFPSYVLIKMLMTDESWHVIRNIRGVTGFVGPGSKPVPLTDEEVASIGIEIREISLDYKVGDSVKIAKGPLAGYVGTVESISDDKKVIRVLASMFGRETPVELSSNEVEVIEI